MQQLAEEETDTLALVVSSDMSSRDMAEMTGTSEQNVKVRVHRARVKLRKSPAQENEKGLHQNLLSARRMRACSNMLWLTILSWPWKKFNLAIFLSNKRNRQVFRFFAAFF